jgi:predicted DNA-binding transcriptional regulator AlpA
MDDPDNKQFPAGFLDLKTTRQFAGNPGISTLYKWMSNGTFPKPYTTGANRRGWKVSDLTAWRDALPKAEYRTKVAA